MQNMKVIEYFNTGFYAIFLQGAKIYTKMNTKDMRLYHGNDGVGVSSSNLTDKRLEIDFSD